MRIKIAALDLYDPWQQPELVATNNFVNTLNNRKTYETEMYAPDMDIRDNAARSCGEFDLMRQTSKTICHEASRKRLFRTAR